MKMGLRHFGFFLIRKGLRPGLTIERFTQAGALAAFLRNQGINMVIDVGANRGQFALKLRSIGFSGRICSFEPSPTDAAHLRQASAEDPNWIIHGCALGQTPGTADFNVVRQPSGLTVLSSFLAAGEGIGAVAQSYVTEVVEVQVKTLDAVFDSLIEGLPNPRVLLKIDTQGFDLEVLKGGRACIDKIRALQSEVSLLPIYRDAPDLTEALGFYRELGFAVFDMAVVNRTADGLVIEYDCLLLRDPELTGTSTP
jgi:FkbM family methyltransferase